MSFSQILVHVDETPSAALRARTAADLARRFKAHLTGVFLTSEYIRQYMAAESLGAPMPELLLETSGWAPHVAALQARGESVDTWAAHDDSSGFDDLCRADLRREPAARVWRIFSNQYFLPLLLLNAHHARPLAAMGGSGGLWGPALRVLLRPQQRLLDAAAAYVTRVGLGRGGARVVGIHARSPLDNAARREATLGCARTRLRAQNASVLFLATLEGHKRCKQVLTEGEPYEIIRKAPRAAPAEGAAQQDLKRSDSHWSLRRGRSMRLQQWGSWIAYEDPNLDTLFWCD